jgi:hypothetical protein
MSLFRETSLESVPFAAGHHGQPPGSRSSSHKAELTPAMAKLQTTAIKAKHILINNLKLLCTQGDWHPSPSLHQPARTPVARGTGSRNIWMTLNGRLGSFERGEEKRKCPPEGVSNIVFLDREGSGAFEAMLRLPDKKSPQIPELGLKELITIACWYIWRERRKISHDEKVQKPAKSAHAIAAIALNYWRALKKNARDRSLGWEKPKEDYVKLNVDAAFSPDSCSGATGSD